LDFLEKLVVEFFALDSLEQILLVVLGEAPRGDLQMLNRVRVFGIDNELAEDALPYKDVTIQFSGALYDDVTVSHFI